MYKLAQTENMILAAGEAERILEEKPYARLLVISDTHGEYEMLEEILLEFGADCDAFVFCGDGTFDVVSCLEKTADDRKLSEAIPPVIAVARGNGDADQYAAALPPDETEGATPPFYLAVPERALFRAAGRTILVVHGHRYNVDQGTEMLASAARTMDADMVFYGHTHIPFYEEVNATLIMNPGSAARPRGGYPPSFAIVSFPGTTERFEVTFFEVRRNLFGSYSFIPFPCTV